MPGPDILPALVAGTKAKAGDLNNKFDSVKSWGSSIPLTDLADGTAGQLIVANASGVPTYVTPAGAVAVTNAGATSIGYYHDTAGDTTLVLGDWGTLLARTPAAGTYLAFAKFTAYSSASFEVYGRLVAYGGAAEFDRSIANLPPTALNYNAPITCMGTFTTDGSVICVFQGMAVTIGGTPTAAQNKMTLIRVA